MRRYPGTIVSEVQGYEIASQVREAVPCKESQIAFGMEENHEQEDVENIFRGFIP